MSDERHSVRNGSASFKGSLTLSMPERATTLLSPELLRQLSLVPRLAAQHGKGFTLLDGTQIKYFPVQDLPDLPRRFAEVMRSAVDWRLGLESLLLMLVAIEPQSQWSWKNSLTSTPSRTRRQVKL